MANKIYGSNNEPLKVQVITDVHYYSRKASELRARRTIKWSLKSQMVIKDSPYVIKRGFDMLCEDKSTDIVLLSGDTTHDGEMDSHTEFIEMLRGLRAAAREFM